MGKEGVEALERAKFMFVHIVLLMSSEVARTKRKGLQEYAQAVHTQEGNPLPFILTLPPTSIKNFRNYVGKRW